MGRGLVCERGCGFEVCGGEGYITAVGWVGDGWLWGGWALSAALGGGVLVSYRLCGCAMGRIHLGGSWGIGLLKHRVCVPLAFEGSAYTAFQLLAFLSTSSQRALLLPSTICCFLRSMLSVCGSGPGDLLARTCCSHLKGISTPFSAHKRLYNRQICIWCAFRLGSGYTTEANDVCYTRNPFTSGYTPAKRVSSVTIRTILKTALQTTALSAGIDSCPTLRSSSRLKPHNQRLLLPHNETFLIQPVLVCVWVKLQIEMPDHLSNREARYREAETKMKNRR